jgi:hypothetical protein
MKEFFALIISIFFPTSIQQDHRIDLLKNPWEICETTKDHKEILKCEKMDSLIDPIEKYFAIDKKYAYYEYSSKFQLKSNYLDTNISPALHFPFLGEVFSIYINDAQVNQQGYYNNKDDFKVRTLRNIIIPIDIRILKQENSIIVRFSGDPRAHIMGFFYPQDYILSNYEDIVKSQNDFIGNFLILFYFLFGLYHFYLYLKNKNDKNNLNIFFLTINVFIYFFARSNYFHSFDIDTTYLMRLEYSSLIFTTFSLLYFQEILLKGEINLASKIFKWFTIILSISCWISEYYLLHNILRTWQYSNLLFVFLILYTPIVEYKKGNPDAKNILFGLLLIIFFLFLDLYLILFKRIYIVYSKYTFFFYILSLGSIIASRLNRLNSQNFLLNEILKNKLNDIQELNKNLELRVNERTFELSQSLKYIEILKEKQDADYFLISLIADPLIYNHSKDKNLSISYHIEQHKKFSFKNKIYQIGGDNIIVDSLNFYNKLLTIFINGDAMGKSLQGASGAIVLGVIFKSLVNNKKFNNPIDLNSPELLLRDIFLDLQKVFESFDGLMLSSILMGLIDSDTGTLYFINAEHPSGIIFRNNNAHFIPQYQPLYKAGTSYFKKGMHVNVFELKENDVLFFGSDGRDDLLISEDKDNKINEDKNLILKIIEESKADLKEVLKNIKIQGQLIDDLSLIRIQINSIEQKSIKDIPLEILQIDSPSNFSFDFMMKVYLNLEDHWNIDQKIEFLLWIMNSYPYENSNFEKLIKLYDSKNELQSAIKFAEIYRLRTPDKSLGLELLISLHKKNNDLTNYNKYVDKLNQFNENL